MLRDRDITPQVAKKRLFPDVNGREVIPITLELHFGGGYSIQDRFAKVKWNKKNVSNPSSTFTTHPDWLIRTFEVGPDAFDERPKQENVEDIITVESISRQYPNPPLKNAHILTHDSANGLITVYNGEPIMFDYPGYGELTPIQIPDPKSQYSEPNDIYNAFSLEALYLPHFKQIPALQQSYAKLGVSYEKNNKSITLPTPQEFSRKMDELRNSDTNSGIFYPEIELIPTGSLTKEEYLGAYSRRKLPVATNLFDYYDHDAFSAHIVALQVYGEPLVELLGTYAEKSLSARPVGQSFATKLIDELTDFLGEHTLDPSFVARSAILGHLSFIAEEIRRQDRNAFDNLQLVQRLRGQDENFDKERIHGADLFIALSTLARERLAS